MNRHQLRYCLAFLAVVVSAGLITSTVSTAPRTQPVGMTIVVDTIAGYAVSPDIVDGQLKETYTDWKVSPGGDVCVNGVAAADGSVFMRLNRRQEWPDGRIDLWCHERPEGTEPKYQDRSYSLFVQVAVACQQLGYPETPCTVVPDKVNQPHVRADTVFKSKAKTSFVSWQLDRNGRHFQVTTTQPVLIQSVSSNVKSLTWNGDAALTETGGTGPLATFPLPFKVVFVRY